MDDVISTTVAAHHNPVWDGYLADPFVLKAADGYYAYGTGGEGRGGRMANGHIFPVLHSSDLVTWTLVGGALDTDGMPSNAAFWAPEVAERDGTYFLYYSADDGVNENTHRLRVAVADKPAGPFCSVGGPLMPDRGFTIDASPFRDPVSGAWWLFYATDFFDERVGTALAAVRLGDDMVSVKGEPVTILRASADWQIYQRNRSIYGQTFSAWHTLEGPAVRYRDSRYYVLYSGGNWQTPGYGMGFAVADSVSGPYSEAQPSAATVLRSESGIIGPGHASVVEGPDGADWLVYHRWNEAMTKRQMCIDPLEWMDSGPVCRPT